MNPDWFIPHVLDKIGTRRTITYGMTDYTGTISPELRAFVTTRLVWLDQLTGLSFVEAADPFLQFYRTHEIPVDQLVDGLAHATEDELSVYVLPNPVESNDRAQFVLIHELGHVLGLDHPFGDSLHPVWTNDRTIMSGTKARDDRYRTWFSPLDLDHLQQLYGPGDPITGTIGADRLTGTAGPDVILGGGGPDRIRGAAGSDLLYGGGGKDIFILERSVPGYYQYDLVEDFSKKDRLQLKGNLNPGKVVFTKDGGDAFIYFKNDLMAYIPNTPFLDMDYFLV